MKITKEISLEEFEGWSGAENTLDKIISEGKAQELEFILEDLYPEGMDETQLNDLCGFLSLRHLPYKIPKFPLSLLRSIPHRLFRLYSHSSCFQVLPRLL